MKRYFILYSFFFFNDTATTEIYTLSLHDALPIYVRFLTSSTGTVTDTYQYDAFGRLIATTGNTPNNFEYSGERSEEHTSELQSRLHLVCRLLLEKKKKVRSTHIVNNYTIHLRCTS